jgi:hypothetical protein
MGGLLAVRIAGQIDRYRQMYRQIYSRTKLILANRAHRGEGQANMSLETLYNFVNEAHRAERR